MISEELLDASEQFRLCRFQVANWGTFSGIHDIDISEKGHLFVGGSGSGKSTLLDAMSVLLTPGRINFNAAAREGEKRSDRSLITYIRGAWTTLQDEDGSASLRYLRTKSTWSAIALTYKSNLERTVSLVFIGYVRGSSTEDTAVNKQYLIVPSDFSINDINDFAQVDFNIRLVKKRFPSVIGFASFSPYCEKMRQYFNIKEENVLKLLNKAQSAKNLGDINSFFREYMLEKPGTFVLADSLVEEFTELKSAYELVKKARQQVEVLNRAKENYEKKEKADQQRVRLMQESEYVDVWRCHEELRLVSDAIPGAEKSVAAKEAELFDLKQAIKLLEDEIHDLEKILFSSGGEAIAALQRTIDELKERKKATQRRLQGILPHLETLNEVSVQNAVQWNQLLSRIEEKNEVLNKERKDNGTQRNTLIIDNSKAEEEFKSKCREIENMKRHPSNISSDLLELREALCQKLDIEESQLPFVGELMQIREGEKDWQGACERVLSSFTRSMLVDEKNYDAIARYINATHLGTKLLYNRVPDMQEKSPDPDPQTVPGKFDLREGKYRRWLQKELMRRFNYRCVAGPEDFVGYEKAVTIAGQIKHNHVRHEKDDRRRIGDRNVWFTGFSNKEKLRAFEKEAHKLAQKIVDFKKAIDLLEAKDRKVLCEIRAIETLKACQWEDLDVNTVILQLSQKETQYKELTAKSRDIETLNGKIREKKERRGKLLENEQSALEQLGAFKGNRDSLNNRKTMLLKQVKDRPRIEDFDKDFERIIKEIGKEAVTRETLPSLSNHLGTRLNNSAVRIQNIANLAFGEVTSAFKEFKRLWPAESADLDDKYESAPEYFEKLVQLEQDGLPKYEDRFFDLLKEHAQQNIIELGREIRDEADLIKERLKLVNDSLAQVAFNRNNERQTHLRINVKDRHLQQVAEFWKLQNEIIQDSIQDDRALGEKQFEKIHSLIQLLDPNNTQNRMWRERVLDVREHVEFTGLEFNDAGETLEVYSSGAGKSGGQRQKLTITCLAAALRYQLGGTTIAQPTYAPVVLDEAFDKADSDFTDISMRIFQEFGFQLIIATPEKGVYTLEPYVGATTYVQCRDRRISSVTPIVYHEESGSFNAAEVPQ